MPRYVSYLLDLASEGAIRIVEKSIRYAPDPDRALIPKTAFVWNVVVADTREVWVRGMSHGEYALIAAARWDEYEAKGGVVGGLVAQMQEDAKNPTGYQWNLIEDSVRSALARAERAFTDGLATGPLASDKIERPSDKELDALIPTDEASAEMQKNLRANQVASAKAIQSVSTRRRGVWLGIGTALLVIAVVAVPIVRGLLRRGQDKPAVSTYENGDPVPTSDAADVAMELKPPPDAAVIDASPDEAVLSAKSLPSAIALSKSAFTVSTSNDLSEGALRLAHFNHMQWSDVDVAAETTLPLIEKDAEAELGKRVCVEGQILSIRRRDLEQPPRPAKKLFVGRLRAANDEDIAFVAVGSTGSLVKLDKARFCGVSTGLVINIAGLNQFVPELLGMFDLPETRLPQAEQ